MTTALRDCRSDVECYEIVFAFDNRRYVEKQGYTITANLMTTRNVFAKVGDFSATVSEDVDWCERARRSGFTLGYTSRAVVSHPARRDWPELVKKWKRLTRETYLLNVNRGRGNFYWFLRSWLILLSPFGHVFVVSRTDRLKSWRERFGATQILLRLRFWRFAECLRVMMRASFDVP